MTKTLITLIMLALIPAGVASARPHPYKRLTASAMPAKPAKSSWSLPLGAKW
jgi:hypothetical protein